MFFTKTVDGYLLRVRLQPNSSCCKILGVMQNADGAEFLKICINSVPEKGKANKELLDFLAKVLDVAKSELAVKTGLTDRWKIIEIKTNKNLDEKLKETECLPQS